MRNSSIKSTIKELNAISKLLKEAYVFDGDDEGVGASQEEMEMSPEEEMVMNHETDDIIDQIRQLALDGIQKYAEDVDNEMYITYKKIWMMCDKCLSEKEKVDN